MALHTCKCAAGIGWGGRERESQDVSEPSVSWGIVDAGEEGFGRDATEDPKPNGPERNALESTRPGTLGLDRILLPFCCSDQGT